MSLITELVILVLAAWVEMTLIGRRAENRAPLTEVLDVQIREHGPRARRNLPILQLLEQLKARQRGVFGVGISDHPNTLPIRPPARPAPAASGSCAHRQTACGSSDRGRACSRLPRSPTPSTA